MKTPREKAEELVNRFYKYLTYDDSIKSAIVLVSEIIKISYWKFIDSISYQEQEQDFWEDVMNELKKL